jgi:hypothetical protein
MIGKVRQIDKRTLQVRRPFNPRRIGPWGAEKITPLPFFRRICEDPPRIKKQSSHKGNRHDAAKWRPNPTRNFKKLAHNFHSFIR